MDGRKTEVSSAQASGMEETFQDLQIKEIRSEKMCFSCGFSFPHSNKQCPAKNANCYSLTRKLEGKEWCAISENQSLSIVGSKAQ